MQKFILALALLVAIASAGGYLKASNVASDLIDSTNGAILNNPYKLFAAAGAMAYGWFFCSWSMIFGADYKSCIYTHVYYAVQ
eukprot:NODE_10732_length_326_cov_53.303249_g9819_i0.p1 GENE.NODE_10732_length_326_cov_53.303249_g9819_i0~~NODE_10732_length_326_cov_53.303249_g9819_i0.p1  ORF type:complete len:97 (+),score=30.51 NODE_10732_length_326_cov_53.303249_g9819_i0:45-293(+)